MTRRAQRIFEYFSQQERSTHEIYEALVIAVKALEAGQETLASMGYSYPEADAALSELALRDSRGT